MMILLFCLITVFDEPVFYRNPTIYRPLTSLDCAVMPNGNVFMSDNDQRLYLFSPSGQIIKTLGGRGRAPGEFISPSSMGTREDTLWVYDFMSKRITLYDDQGTLLRVLYRPGLGKLLFGTARGWYFPRYRYGLPEPLTITAVDTELTDTQEIFREIPQWMSAAKPQPAGIRAVKANTAMEHLRWSVSVDGSLFFLAHVGRPFKVSVIDTRTHKLIRTINPGWSPVPFDVDREQEKLDRFNKERKRGNRVRLEAPEYYPFLKAMTVTPDDRLVLERYGINDRNGKNLFVFDFFGRPAELTYQKTNAYRLIAVQDAHAYLTGYDGEIEQGMVIRCAATEIDRIAGAFPITFEEEPRIVIPLKY
ncbi:MAG: hypothetical protein QNK37_25605 [Acidobacteriota bacterium]|nr:hypothetical protein [Acidobacteriota bacterium]